MEIGKEANMVIDKLASILGNTGGEIVNEYTQLSIYEGVGNIIGCLLLVLFCVGCGKLILWSLTRLAKDDENAMLGPVVMFAASLTGLGALAWAICCLFNAICYLGAPKAMAIKTLMSQLSRMM